VKRVVLAGAVALVALAPGVAFADPGGGAQATPGTLTCPGASGATTSGADLASAVQFADGSRVLVVTGSVEFPDWQRGHVPGDRLVTCTLSEDSIGGSVTVFGILTGQP